VTVSAGPPALYVGTVRHRRFAVRRHAFRHRIALGYVDLERLPRGGALVRFDPDDFLAPARVRELAGADGPIGLLAQPRSLGKGFNPVSFYYCHDDAGALRAVVAEVTSTPWGQRHAYVMKLDGSGRRVGRAELAKRLHVSPFMGMDQRYTWSTTEPGSTLAVHISSSDDHAAARPAFDATLNLRRRPYSSLRLAGGALRTLALIYAHALVLALKRVPIHPRPEEAHP
jgi:DUF1365 family protein